MAKGRLDYIDWMRGLACLLMFQTHAYDSWLSPGARKSSFFGYSQLLGTFPAPMFLFLAGVSLALGIDRLASRNAAATAITSNFIKRGLEIFALGLLFRLQEFLIVYPWAPRSDLGRVDILNTIGLSLVFAGLVPLVARTPRARALVSVAAALAISLLTPPLWTTHKPHFEPWWIATYINGGHTDYQPKAWLFPLFPWAAFTFAGAAAGAVMMQARRLGRERLSISLLASTGAALWWVARWLDHSPVQLYAAYDYWHTSPNFFLARVGILLGILAACYGWCALKRGRRWSPVQQLGMTSLLVYWVHIEFVYGRFTILHPRANTIPQASLGLATIVAAMLLLSLGRTTWKANREPLLVKLGLRRAVTTSA